MEWTPLGTAAIREKRYLFISPTWRPGDGAGADAQLVGAGLTNRPFFTELPALTADTVYDRPDDDDGDELAIDLTMFADREQSMIRRGVLEVGMDSYYAAKRAEAQEEAAAGSLRLDPLTKRLVARGELEIESSGD